MRLARPWRGRVGRTWRSPGSERHLAPFETGEAGEGVAEDFGGHVFGVVAVADAAGYVGVDAVEVGLVEVGETGGVGLRRFH